MQMDYDMLMDMLEELFERIKQEAIMENRTGNIETFKVKYGIKSEEKRAFSFNEKAKILIIGLNNATIKAKDLDGIFKAASIPGQFEVISYDEATNFDLESPGIYHSIFRHLHRYSATFHERNGRQQQWPQETGGRLRTYLS